MSGPCVTDSETVELTVDGGALRADAIVSPDPSNLLQATADGLNVPGSGAAVPVGTILPYGGATPPDGYLICDGTAVSRSTYAALFAKLGTRWGGGDGVSTFNLPPPGPWRRIDRATAETAASVAGVGNGAAADVLVGNAVQCDGSQVRVRFWAPDISTDTAGCDVFAMFKKDGAEIGHWRAGSNSITGGNHVTAHVGWVYDTPVAGLHTYSVAAYVNFASTGVFQAGAGGPNAWLPMFIEVEQQDVSIVKV